MTIICGNGMLTEIRKNWSKSNGIHDDMDV